MSELGQFVSGIPAVTRTITLTSLVMGGLHSLQLIPISAYTCYFPYVWQKLEVHRLLTGFLVPNPQAMQGMMEIYMMYSFSRGIEEGKFKKNLPDYLWYFAIVLPIILISAFVALPPVYSLSPALLSALTFTWSVLNYNQQVNFYFMPIKASLLPAVSLGFRLLVDGHESFVLALMGFAAAYVYNCLETHTFGPLISVITGKEPDADTSNNRLGTVNTMTSHAWFYSTGFLGAPGWLKRVVSKLMGVDYDSVVYRRNPGAAAGTGAKRRASASTSGARNSTRGSGSPAGGFKGEGRRLGSVKME
jgi:Derlin-2/3